MTFGERVKSLRREFGLSQEALGAQGFVSTPGWIKIENGQRHASEKLIDNLLKWLVSDKYLKLGALSTLREELLTLKYLSSNSLFVREMAKDHARKSSNSNVAAALETLSAYKKKPKLAGSAGKNSSKPVPAKGSAKTLPGKKRR